MNLQINMICKQCDQVLPVTVKLEDQIEAEASEEPYKHNHHHNLFEQVSCPQCGKDHVWDRQKRNFVNS